MAEVSLYNYKGALPAFARSAGPRSNVKIAIVGEALGEQEDMAGTPFFGVSGQELTKLLREAGISRSECFLTNVMAFRPQSNNIEFLCVKKKDLGNTLYPMPAYANGKYIHPQFLGELTRLREELNQVNPNLILALGNTACWALLLRTNIGSIRGTITESIGLERKAKLLATYHPAAVLRQWSHRPIVLADLMKAKLEQDTDTFTRPERFITVRPDLPTIHNWIKGLTPKTLLSVDIETAFGQITMIGFASSKSEALVIPFVDPSQPDNCYWKTEAEEKEAWQAVKYLIEEPKFSLLFQNGLYDLQFITRMGFKANACFADTMLLHHSLFPELKKGLGFLGSIYTNEPAWKLMRDKDFGETNKKDE